MALRVQCHISKQATLLGVLDVSLLKWRVCGCGLNRFVHEGMSHISNVNVHLKIRSGNVNIYLYLYYQSSISFQLSPNLTGFSEILN